jgi:hypothetical protein
MRYKSQDDFKKGLKRPRLISYYCQTKWIQRNLFYNFFPTEYKKGANSNHERDRIFASFFLFF